MKQYDKICDNKQLTFSDKLINRLIKVFTTHPFKAFQSLLSNESIDSNDTYDFLLSNIDADVNDELVNKYKGDIRFQEIANYNQKNFKFYVHLLSLLDSLNVGGTLILKIPIQSRLVDKHIELLEVQDEYLELNEYLISSNLLKAIIRLPSISTSSSSKRAERILIFKKNNVNEGVYLVDPLNKRLNNFNSKLSSKYEDLLIDDIINNYLNSYKSSHYSTHVSTLDIKYQGYTLNFDCYLNKRELNVREKSSVINYETNTLLMDCYNINQKINALIYKIYDIDNSERLALDILFKESRD